MNRWVVVCMLTLFSSVWSVEIQKPLKTPPPLSEVDAQVRQAEAEFAVARKMFNPWYAGPLLTPGAHNVPPGSYVVQGYTFVRNTYATFNENRRSQNIPDIWSVSPTLIFQMGWFSWVDFAVIGQGVYNTQSGNDSFNIGDTSLIWGFPLLKEAPYQPAVRFTIGESFPSGKYEKLNPAKGGIDATGSGAYTTTFSLNFSKVVWWISDHPFAVRTSLNYGISTLVDVKGFNTYGGGKKTRGRVRPGNTLTLDTAIEFSFTQKWVLAVDLVYAYQNRSTFSGHRGTTLTGVTPSVGAPSGDSLSAAPALEYNPSDHMGFLLGAWFTITGRNSPDFITGVITMYYAW